jgi:hypothetical protein
MQIRKEFGEFKEYEEYEEYKDDLVNRPGGESKAHAALVWPETELGGEFLELLELLVLLELLNSFSISACRLDRMGKR